MRPARASVIVPCLNEADHIEALLDAVRLQDEPPCEVIVVDGGSVDGTRAIVERYQADHPGFPVTLLVKPPGWIPVSLNAGIGVAAGDIVARLDAHSRPRPDYLGRLARLLSVSNVGVTGGRWEIEPGDETRVARAIAWAVQHPFGAGDAAYRVAPARGQVRPVDTVPFGCFEKSLWASLDGFNERLQVNEDYDFNHRVRLAGREVLLDPSAVSTYVARETLGQLARQYFRYGWWKVEMLRRYPRALRWRQAVPMLFVLSLGILGVGTAVTSVLVPWLAALLLAYAAVAAIVTASMAYQRRAWWALAVLPVVFAVIHMAWGSGALLNLMTFGRWPGWR